jgi:uncharacterized protein (TIGR02145 family)
MKKLFLFAALLVIGFSNAQVGIGTNTPNTSAALDITSTSQGFLLPRLTYAQKTAIASPPTGLQVWCTDCGTTGELQFYNGTIWKAIDLVSGSFVRPDAPTSPIASAGIAQASVAFTASIYNGGSAITGYTVTSSPDGFTATGSTSPIVVTGLTNGTSYTFTVVATNVSVNSFASPASNVVTPAATVPDAPTSPIATADNALISVAFSAPAFNGGSPIMGYIVTASSGGFTATGTTSPIIVTGLTNGTSYTFTVVATNIVGNSVASAASNAVTPMTIPNAPTSPVATAGNTQASVAFTAPIVNGGSSITGYTVTASPGGFTKTGTTSPLIVTGLTNGTSYTFTVVATNTVGNSVASAASNGVTPLLSTTIGSQVWTTTNLDVATYRNGDVIPQVTDGTAWSALTTGAWCYQGNNSANGAVYGKLYNWYAVNDPRGLAPLGWHIPSDAEWTTLTTTLGGTALAGGAMKETGTTHWLSPNTGATNSNGFTALPGGYYNGTFNSLTSSGLWWSSSESDTNNAKFRVIDYNAAFVNGGSPNKAAGLSVRCSRDAVAGSFTVPDAPTSIVATAGSAEASVAFTPIYNGGSAVTGYTVTSSPDGFTKTGTTSPIVVTGLTNGTSYTFTVVATNAVGNSVASAASNGVMPLSNVTIGTQVWTSTNLDVTTYRNGDVIPQVTSTSAFWALTTGAWCYYNNNSANNTVYGKLYNWFAVNDPRGLAPTGWHIPSDNEWATLTGFLGGDSVAGSKMKETGILHWASPNSGSTNSSGFTAVPGGYNNGAFGGMSGVGIWWSSSESSTTNYIFGRVIDNNFAAERRDSFAKAHGFSVRCRKDAVAGSFTVADAPTSIVATAGIVQASVTFTAPTSDGGSAITGYSVTSSPASSPATFTGTGSPIVVTGLTYGTSYTFMVVATNAAGNSVASAASNAVTPFLPITIGLHPELGGYVFYVAPDGLHGLVSETQDQGYTDWYNTLTYSGVFGSSQNYSAAGQNFFNWRLPTIGELTQMYNSRNEIGGFGSYYYWSSTEDVQPYAYLLNFSDGLVNRAEKRNWLGVRGVRAF